MTRKSPGRVLGGGAALTAALLLLGGTVHAHPLAPALLDIREAGAGAIEVTWKVPTVQPQGAPVEPRIPADCRATGRPVATADARAVRTTTTYTCRRTTLVGAEFGVDGLARSRTNALLRVELAGGRVLSELLDANRPTFTIPERQSAASVAARYVALGAEHIAGGYDHLLFVLALMLLVAGPRALLAAVSAFTLGHSITLAAAVLGYVTFPSSLAELLIAASIVVLAAELLHAEPTAIRRRPGVAAALFGLLHGLGFAGALSEIGLPAGEIPSALFAFNVGIELGQLAFVGAALLALRILAAMAPSLARGPIDRRRPWQLFRSAASASSDENVAGAVPAPAAGYLIGTLAASWTLERMLGML